MSLMIEIFLKISEKTVGYKTTKLEKLFYDIGHMLMNDITQFEVIKVLKGFKSKATSTKQISTVDL